MTSPTKAMAVVERGTAIELACGVKASVFHVETAGERYMVYETFSSGGQPELLCTCPQVRGCEHAAAVIAHMARLVAQSQQGPELADAERVSWTTGDGLGGFSVSMPPQPPSSLPAAALAQDRDLVRKVAGTLERILCVIADVGIARGRGQLTALCEELRTCLLGVSGMDAARACAELRDLVLAEAPDPGRAAVVLERVRGVIEVARAFLDRGAPIALEASYLGRTFSFDESERLEDMTLVEMARSSTLTPFGLRRNRAYYLDTYTGRTFVEHTSEGTDEVSVPTVGPFPRRIHAGLMIVTPGLGPSPVRLLQYVIMPPPGENELLKIKKSALTTVAQLRAALRQTTAAALAPCPSFVAFAPARVLRVGNQAVVADADGGRLSLAYRSRPPVCDALASMAGTMRIHCVTGHVVWTGYEVALDPLSVLLENGSGLGLLRLR